MGFWSTLAAIGGDIGGAFIGDPLLGNQVMSVAGALTGSSGSSASNGGLSVQLPPTTPSPYVASGASGINSAKNYFTAALNGDQTTMQELLGPEINTVLAQYDNAAKTAANLGPRGGGRTETLAKAPFQKAEAYGTALAGAQNGAAKNLGELGAEESTIGLQEQAQQNQYNIAQGNLNLGQNKTNQAGYQYTQGQISSLGKGLGGILTNTIAGQKVPGAGTINPNINNPVTTGSVDLGPLSDAANASVYGG